MMNLYIIAFYFLNALAVFWLFVSYRNSIDLLHIGHKKNWKQIKKPRFLITKYKGQEKTKFSIIEDGITHPQVIVIRIIDFIISMGIIAFAISSIIFAFHIAILWAMVAFIIVLITLRFVLFKKLREREGIYYIKKGK